MIKSFCDLCGKELVGGYMQLDASYSLDPSVGGPGHKMGWDICLVCFGELPLKVSEMARRRSGMPMEGQQAARLETPH